MADSNFNTSISDTLTRCLALIPSASAKDLFDISVCLKSIKQTESTSAEQLIATRIGDLLSSATALEKQYFARAIMNMKETTYINGVDLPTQTGHILKLLETNGINTSWVRPTLDEINGVNVTSPVQDNTLGYDGTDLTATFTLPYSTITTVASESVLPVGTEGDLYYAIAEGTFHYFDGAGWLLVTVSFADPTIATFGTAFADAAVGTTTNFQAGMIRMSPDKSQIVMGDPNYATGSGTGVGVGRVTILKQGTTDWEFVENIVPASRSPNSNASWYLTYYGANSAWNSDGSRLAVLGRNHGATGSGANYEGAVWIYERQGDDTYSEVSRIDRPKNANNRAERGIDMTPDGNYIAIPGYNDGTSATDYVLVDIYEYDSGTSTYSKMESDTVNSRAVSFRSAGQNQYFGEAFAKLSSNGEYCLVMAEEAWHFNTGAGYAMVGYYNGTDWTRQQELEPTNLYTTGTNPRYARYGASGAITSDGSMIVVSDPEMYNFHNSSWEKLGAVLVWKRTGTTWTMEQLIENPNKDSTGYPRQFGQAIRMNGDGTKMFVHATQGQSGGNNSEIYCYDYDGTSWSLAETIDTGIQTPINAGITDTGFDADADGNVAVMYDQNSQQVKIFERS